jgi:glycolate oxidase FAD binding subunit
MREPGGPDLNRLLCGSQGALAVLVSATLRVQPAPSGQLWVGRSVWTPLEVHDLVKQVQAASLAPSAIEVDLPAHRAALIPRQRSRQGPGTVAVLLEGGNADVVERADRLIAVLRGDARALEGPPRWWHRYPFEPGEVAVRLEVPITDLHAAIYALRDAVGGPVPVRGSAGVGVVRAALPSSLSADRVGEILSAVRGVLLFRGGRCVVTCAPPAMSREIDLWGQVPALPTLREAKERFDPAHRLAPGRYVGGL